MSDIAHLRLANQQIVHSRCTTQEEVVHTLGAMQAQDYASALWAIGTRLPSSKQGDIERAIAERRIVRTWAMRGTIHFLAAEDVHWMLQLLAPRVLGNTERRDAQLGLDAATYTKSAKLLAKALLGGKQLPRDEVYAVLESGKISTEGQRGYHILWHLGLQGLVCFGTHACKQPTFTLLEESVDRPRKLAHDEALAELALRYFTSRGPATAQDFAAWSKLSLTEARTAVSSIAGQLLSLQHQGETCWMSPSAPASAAMPETFLLPAFDEYLLGYKERSAVLDAQHAGKVVPGGNGMFLPMMVLRGQVVGTWKRKLKKKTVSIEYSPFGKLKKADLAAFDKSAQRYGEFLGLMVE